jgi:hypothetical protein
LDALGRTLRSKRASLSGARRFYAGEGLFVFADSKEGLANIASDIYLPPGAYNALGNFLDQNATPAIVGWRLSAVPTTETLPQMGRAPLESFAKAAEQTLHKHVHEEERTVTLQAAESPDADEWAWEGVLSYETNFTLDGGVHIYDEANVSLFARATVEGDIDVAAITTQGSDREAVESWLCRVNRGNWLIQPIVLPTKDPARLRAIQHVIEEFGDARFIGMRSPEIYPTSGTKRSRFASVMQRAPYQTKITELEVVVERMQTVDEGFLGTFTAFLLEGHRKAVTSLELRQRPHESYARLAWKAGKSVEGPLTFNDEWWDKATPVDWSNESKHRYLLAVWDEVLVALDRAWASDAATDHTHVPHAKHDRDPASVRRASADSRKAS